MERLAGGVELRLRNDLLATPARLAKGRCLPEAAPPSARSAQCQGESGLVAGGRGQRIVACRFWGAQTGPSPVDRRKTGSKHHLVTDAGGTPLASVLTGANRHDVTQLLPLIDAIPSVRGKAGRPRRRPQRVQGDRGYDSQSHRRRIRERGIKPVLARRRTAHGSGLGVFRWVVERTLSWLHQNRRLRTRYERRDDTHKAFMQLACAMICWKTLHRDT